MEMSYFLFKTKDRPIFEATTCPTHGCGFSLSDRDKIGVDLTKGQNETGQILVRVREALKPRYPLDVVV